MDGKEQNVLPRDVAFDTVSDQPIHLDFLRIIKGSKIILEIPVKFVNNEKIFKKAHVKIIGKVTHTKPLGKNDS